MTLKKYFTMFLGSVVCKQEADDTNVMELSLASNDLCIQTKCFFLYLPPTCI